MTNVQESENELAALLRCTNFAALKHKNQRRKDADKTPYINHPIGVANILSHEAGVTDLAVLQAALLHDTVEDTHTTFDEIEEHFGPKVRSIVAEVTDDKSLAKHERKQAQIDHAPHCSHEAKFVKLADKLYNLRDLSGKGNPINWEPQRIQEYFSWARKVVSGLIGTHEGMEQEIMELCEKGAPTK